MGLDRTRVALLGGASLVLFVASTLVLDWFEIRGMGAKVSIDLRKLHVCDGLGRCASVAMSKKNGFSGNMYSIVAQAAFWLGLGFAGLVGFQSINRFLTGSAPEAISRYGYLLGAIVFVCGGAAAYVFGFDVGENAVVSVVRTWAPLMFLGATLAGMFALYYAIDHDYDSMVAPRELPEARQVPFPMESRPITTRAATIPPSPAPSSTSGPTQPRATTPIPIPAAAAGNIAYATLTVEMTVGGIDGRREDRSSVLVLWRDVVGVVVRRMPPDYEAATFIDVVSTAGSTVRILPWTRVSGVASSADGDARARTVVEMIRQKCPSARIDAATQAFLDGRPAAQLPDLATLAAHDERLA
jgi:hypothetical protein